MSAFLFLQSGGKKEQDKAFTQSLKQLITHPQGESGMTHTQHENIYKGGRSGSQGNKFL